MKKLLPLAILALAAFTVQAQTTTNLAIRFTLETVTAGVTNSSNTNFRWDYGTKKDALKVDGLLFAYNSYVVAQGTNTPVAFGVWQKQNYVDFANGYAQQKQQADYAALLLKLTSLLTSNSDLLTAGDVSSLNTIAAKAP